MGSSTQELVKVFNLYNYYSDDIYTNFTVKDKKVIGLFVSGTDVEKYFQEVKDEIIKRHYGTEEAAGECYDLNYFPFVFNVNLKRKGEKDIMEVELADSTNDKVIHNLKLHFAKEFQRAVEVKVIGNLERSAGMTREEACKWLEGSVLEETYRYSPYLYCISFSDKYCKENGYPPRFLEVLKNIYITAFNSKLEECGLKNSDFYEYKFNQLYIKDITNIGVIRNIKKHVREQIALDFKTPGREDSKVENFKGILGDWIYRLTGKSIHGYDHDVFIDERKEKGNSFALIPLMKVGDNQFETLSSRDASKINGVFNNFISDVKSKTANSQFANYKEPVYAFSNKQIAKLLPMIMESPIAYNQVNGRFEFAVDLENFRRHGSSRSSSKESTFTHLSNGELPNGPSSGLTELSSPTQEFSVRGHGKELGRSPRQGLLSVVQLNPLDIPGTSKEFSPSPRLNSLEVSYGVAGPSSSVQSVGAMYNVQAGANTWPQQSNYWVPQGSVQLADPWSQSPWPSQGTQLPPPLIPTGPGCSSWQVYPQASSFMVSESSSSGWNKLNDKEKNLFKALLYVFDLINYASNGVYTNFFAKDGKIVSFLHENIDREKYLQAVRDYIIEKYCGTEEKAKEAYNLNEFPFKFLANCEKNQETTVVANISSSALSNLKILVSQKVKVEEGVGAIDINCVKKVEKRIKNAWVDDQQSEGSTFKDACTSCFPDEEVLKDISITSDEEGYCLDRARAIPEVRRLWKAQLQRAKGTEKEEGKDSGFSEGMTDEYEFSCSEDENSRESSGSSSSDQKSIGGGSRKRKSSCSEDEDSLAKKSPKRDTSPLSKLESLSLSSSSHQIG